MKIGIDCRTILNPGFGEQAGVGHYTYFLVDHLLRLDQENEYVLFFDERVSEAVALAFVAGRSETVIRFFPFHSYRQFLPFIYQHLLVSSFIARERCDVFHSPSCMMPHRYRAPSVITVHDLAILRHPEWFPERMLERLSSTRILLPHSVKLAKRIIVPSEATAHDLRDFFSVAREKIAVISHGFTTHSTVPFVGGSVSLEEEMKVEELKAKYSLGNRYLFFVGTIEPRKNLAALVRAFRALREDQSFSRVTLALAGARGWKYDEVFSEIEAANGALESKAVRYLGYVPAGDKFLLMKHAAAFVFPSRYEGFGLPVLEAMGMGTPVVTSNVSALPEVVGNAGLLVDPEHENEITEAMRRVLTDETLRVQLSERGRARAAEYTWTKTAERTLEVYGEVFGK